MDRSARDVPRRGAPGEAHQIPAGPKLLRRIEVKEVTVSLDAMGCQKKTTQEFHFAGADYLGWFEPDERKPWLGLRSVVEVTSIREINNGSKSTEKRYYLTSRAEASRSGAASLGHREPLPLGSGYHLQ